MSIGTGLQLTIQELRHIIAACKSTPQDQRCRKLKAHRAGHRKHGLITKVTRKSPHVHSITRHKAGAGPDVHPERLPFLGS